MNIKIEALSMDRALLGFCYNRGSGTLNEKNGNAKEVIFHEFGIGLLLLQIHITFY
jgi:hypothetical protein